MNALALYEFARKNLVAWLALFVALAPFVIAHCAPSQGAPARAAAGELLRHGDAICVAAHDEPAARAHCVSAVELARALAALAPSSASPSPSASP